jgi:AMP-polyphosphate phosphotransferase
MGMEGILTREGGDSSSRGKPAAGALCRISSACLNRAGNDLHRLAAVHACGLPPARVKRSHVLEYAMFESAEIGHTIDKQTYNEAVPVLREALLAAQYRLREQARFPVLILINGIEGAGKGETIKLLNEWMDPRLIRVDSFDVPTDEELAHPPAWRYWRRLPPKGQTGIFFGNWYSKMLEDRVHGRIKKTELELAIDRSQRFERMLCAEGMLIFKFWFHLSKDRMLARLESLKDDPLHSWRISPLDWQQSKTYDKFVRYGELILRRSSRDFAPWYVIEGYDERYRSLTAGRLLLEGLNAALDAVDSQPSQPHTAPVELSADRLSLLSSLDLEQKLDKDDYKAQLTQEQARLSQLLRDPRLRKRGVLALFEGHDAAGKGSAIRRVTGALDPRLYRIVQIAAPSEDERAQPWLWRFWRNVPARGQFTIFDRSWYGRVLVERVEGFCTPDEWLRAYTEINEFEEQLVDAGVVVVKFWLSIDKDTQLERFKEREDTPHKRFKITEEDWRNRDKWDDYGHAVADMVDRTSTEIAPWTLVEANDKRFARVKVLRTLNQALEDAIG